MDRLIIIGKNCQFPRVSTRPASNPAPPVFSSLDRTNCEASLSSGAQPDAATSGTRQLRASRTSSPPYAPSSGLEVYLPAVVGLVFGWVVVALITLVLL